MKCPFWGTLNSKYVCFLFSLCFYVCIAKSRIRTYFAQVNTKYVFRVNTNTYSAVILYEELLFFATNSCKASDILRLVHIMNNLWFAHLRALATRVIFESNESSLILTHRRYPAHFYVGHQGAIPS